MTLRDTTLSRSDLRAHLRLLEVERRLALASALASDAHYMQDLAEEIDATHTAYIAATVIELARGYARHTMPQG